MSKLPFLIVLILMIGAFASNPTAILVKNDTQVGSYIQDAVAELWPDCYCEVYTDNIPGFMAALESGDWDIVVWDGYSQRSVNQSDYDALQSWYRENKALLFCDWGIRLGISSPSCNLTTAMGAVYAGDFYHTIVPQYCWDSKHPYANNITDWSIVSHGATREHWGFNMAWTSAYPVTGWLAAPYSGYGALLEAENGVGCVSGMFWYSMDDNKEIMKNILSYAWAGIEDSDPYLKVAQTTLGTIKATYQ